LGQWVFDVQVLLEGLWRRDDIDRRKIVLAGIGPAGLVALLAAGLAEGRVAGVAAFDLPATYLTETPYAPPMRMGVLVPGIVGIGDVPHLAALVAPRRLVIAGGITPRGEKLSEETLREAFAFTAAAYKAHKAAERLTVAAEVAAAEVVKML
jgi:hypothetical protein